MTKTGYNQILVSTTVYERLKAVATEHGLSLGKTIARLLENNGIDTGIDTLISKTNNQNLSRVPVQQTDPRQTSFSEREVIETVGSHLAGPAGVEPATPDLEGRCALH